MKGDESTCCQAHRMKVAKSAMHARRICSRSTGSSGKPTISVFVYLVWIFALGMGRLYHATVLLARLIDIAQPRRQDLRHPGADRIDLFVRKSQAEVIVNSVGRFA